MTNAVLKNIQKRYKICRKDADSFGD